MLTFNLSSVPFSRFGSYLALGHRAKADLQPQGILFRQVHGEGSRDVFLLELLHHGRPVAFTEHATPTLVTLRCPDGSAELFFHDPRTLRFRSQNLALRLTLLINRPQFDFAMPVDQGRWLVNSFTHRNQFGLTPLSGELHVDAPWAVAHCTQVIATFLPDPATGLCEGLVEEFQSVWPQRPTLNSFDASHQALQAEYAAWIASQPGLTGPHKDAAELAAYVNWSAVVAPKGHFKRPAMLMSKNWMTNVWSWDQCFNAMALCASHPQLALDQLLVLVDHQDSSGVFPDCYNDQFLIWNFCKPPIHGWAIRHMLRHSNALTTEHLAALYEPLTRWTNYWFTHRDSDHDGMPQYAHGNDSGWDNSTAFDAGTPLEGPDLAAFLIVQMDVLADIAGRLHKPTDAAQWKARADALLNTLIQHSWQNDRFVALRSGTHTPPPPAGDTLVMFVPLVLGKRLPPHIAQALVAGLKQPNRFLTPFGLATENITSTLYSPDGYWRGPIWAPPTLLIIDGLKDLGETAFAQDLAQRFVNLCDKSGFAENFNALTGEPLRDHAYTWTSSTYQILLRDYLST